MHVGGATGAAFGMDVSAGFAVAGLQQTVQTTGRPCAMRVVSAAEMDARWPSGEDVVKLEHLDPAGRPMATSQWHPERGGLLAAPGMGRHHVTADGRSIASAPPDGVADWDWQRYLIGQALPAAAALQDLEPIHAAAVGIDGRAIVLTGPPYAGKSSLALQMVRMGASFLTDDVVTLEADPDRGVLAHPGAGVVSVRADEVTRLGTDGLGDVVGEDAETTRLMVPRATAALPLAAFYFIERPAPVLLATIEPMVPVKPVMLLASTFNFTVRTRSRMLAQLEIHGRIASQIPVFTLRIPLSATATDSALVLGEHARQIGARVHS